MSKLTFGDPESIKIAQQGIECTCKHAKSCHSPYGDCLKLIGLEECECECGNEHEKDIYCECSEFKINSLMKFDKEKGVFKSK